jgi:TRAP-type C4-dicarboxylate transport system permease small subunit
MFDDFELYIERASKAILWVVGISLIFMILMIVIDVFGRYVLNSPLPATFEISQIIMPSAIFPAFAYALATRQHVRVTLVTDRLPPRAQSACDVLAYLLGLVFAVLITYWGWQEFWKSFVAKEIMQAAISVPWWVGKFFMPFGGFFFAIYWLALLLKALSHLLRQAEA